MSNMFLMGVFSHWYFSTYSNIPYKFDINDFVCVLLLFIFRSNGLSANAKSIVKREICLNFEFEDKFYKWLEGGRFAFAYREHGNVMVILYKIFSFKYFTILKRIFSYIQQFYYILLHLQFLWTCLKPKKRINLYIIDSINKIILYSHL